MVIRVRVVRPSAITPNASHTERVGFGYQPVLTGLASRACANVKTRESTKNCMQRYDLTR